MMILYFGNVGGTYPLGYEWRAVIGGHIVIKTCTYKALKKRIDEMIQKKELMRVEGDELPEEIPSWAPQEARYWENE